MNHSHRNKQLARTFTEQEHKAPCSKHKHMSMAKMFWWSWESPFFVFVVAVVIVGFVWVVCFDATDTSKTSKAVWASCHFIQFFMSLPYTASLYHVYANHFMPQLPILLNASGGYFMLSYAASSLCDDSPTLYFILLYATILVWYIFSIIYSNEIL